jgi:molybdenum cofactor guanylyltransferase
MTNRTQTTGIILCGGKSSRMGMNKALLKLGQLNLLEHSILTLQPFCEDIIISASFNEFENIQYQQIKDVYHGIGPISGIYSALLKSKTIHNIIISCDMPFISPEVISYIIENSENSDIVLPEVDGHIQSLTGYFIKSILPGIEEEIKNSHFKPIQMFKSMNLKVLKIDSSFAFYKDYLFFNINTLDDYNEACRIYNNISA